MYANKQMFRCSDCIDKFICSDCRDDSDNLCHPDQICGYLWLIDPRDVMCDCCGDHFGSTEDESFVWQCTKCEDFALCFFCKYQNRHRRHAEFLKTIPIDEYKGHL